MTDVICQKYNERYFRSDTHSMLEDLGFYFRISKIIKFNPGIHFSYVMSLKINLKLHPKQKHNHNFKGEKSSRKERSKVHQKKSFLLKKYSSTLSSSINDVKVSTELRQQKNCLLKNFKSSNKRLKYISYSKKKLIEGDRSANTIFHENPQKKITTQVTQQALSQLQFQKVQNAHPKFTQHQTISSLQENIDSQKRINTDSCVERAAQAKNSHKHKLNKIKMWLLQENLCNEPYSNEGLSGSKGTGKEKDIKGYKDLRISTKSNLDFYNLENKKTNVEASSRLKLNQKKKNSKKVHIPINKYSTHLNEHIFTRQSISSFSSRQEKQDNNQNTTKEGRSNKKMIILNKSGGRPLTSSKRYVSIDCPIKEKDQSKFIGKNLLQNEVSMLNTSRINPYTKKDYLYMTHQQYRSVNADLPLNSPSDNDCFMIKPILTDTNRKFHSKKTNFNRQFMNKVHKNLLKSQRKWKGNQDCSKDLGEELSHNPPIVTTSLQMDQKQQQQLQDQNQASISQSPSKEQRDKSCLIIDLANSQTTDPKNGVATDDSEVQELIKNGRETIDDKTEEFKNQQRPNGCACCDSSKRSRLKKLKAVPYKPKSVIPIPKIQAWQSSTDFYDTEHLI